MKIVFVANMVNHHQKPLCDALSSISDFRFIATERQQQIGYQVSTVEDYLFLYPDDPVEAQRLILEADVAIFGGCPDSIMSERLLAQKLSYIYSERLYKKGIWRRFIPTTYKKVWNRFLKNYNNNLYVLCASAYLSYDLRLTGFNPEHCLKWGYFPDINKHGKKKENSCVQILWAGRMLDWKHPDICLEVAKVLNAQDISFQMKMVGDGPMNGELHSRICNENITNVDIVGSLSTIELRKLMSESDIFLATSDFGEGWGAVVNEAMSEGCAVVGSHAMGSVPYLISHDKNGMIYQSGNVNDLIAYVSRLIQDEGKRTSVQRFAKETMHKMWNAEIAAARLYFVSEALLSGKKIPDYDDGPCSRATIIKNKWIKI